MSKVVSLLSENKVNEVKELLELKYKDLELELIEHLVAFGEQEGEFAVKMISEGVKVDSKDINPPPIRSYMLDQPIDVAPGSSMSIRQALTNFSTARVREVEQVLRDGVGETSQQLIKRVTAVIPLTKTRAGALVRTANNAASTIRMYETFEKNINLFEGYKWVSTLDSNTSKICMARDGEVYTYDKRNPRPPAHWGCRSVIVPKVKRQFDLGADVKGYRPSESGEVSNRLTYGGWLKKQQKAFIDEKLGPARSKLFREGKVSIKGFVDPSGRTYTLEELEALHDLTLS